MYASQNSFWKKFDNKNVFGRMINYLNDKDGYQVYMPYLNKIVHLHDVYFKPERVGTGSVTQAGLENEVWKMWLRRKGKKMT